MFYDTYLTYRTTKENLAEEEAQEKNLKQKSIKKQMKESERRRKDSFIIVVVVIIIIIIIIVIIHPSSMLRCSITTYKPRMNHHKENHDNYLHNTNTQNRKTHT